MCVCTVVGVYARFDSQLVLHGNKAMARKIMMRGMFMTCGAQVARVREPLANARTLRGPLAHTGDVQNTIQYSKGDRGGDWPVTTVLYIVQHLGAARVLG